MNYTDFRAQFFPLICFSPHQVYALHPDFNKNNLTNWLKKEYVIKLKNGLYTFPEYKQESFYYMYFANRMYKPSYISTHTALAFYGLIPEAVVQITNVSSLKTAQFENQFGTYTYQNIQPSLMFGFEAKPYKNGLYMLMAQPEKALLDLLYLNPYYITWQDFEALRIDENLLEELISVVRLQSYAKSFQNKRLQSIVDALTKTLNND
ncbi:MAG TPA: hypothetical protein DG754_00415 [Bacteroidales bacterium]|jgi:predicted transcriptional regulator of viral defense system|nr:hypothetical protein [Bacteroidales bacterium]